MTMVQGFTRPQVNKREGRFAAGCRAAIKNHPRQAGGCLARVRKKEGFLDYSAGLLIQ